MPLLGCHKLSQLPPAKTWAAFYSVLSHCDGSGQDLLGRAERDRRGLRWEPNGTFKGRFLGDGVLFGALLKETRYEEKMGLWVMASPREGPSASQPPLKAVAIFSDCMFRVILGSQEKISIEIFHVPLAPIHALPHYQAPPKKVPLLQAMNPHWHIIIPQSPWFTWKFTLSIPSWVNDTHSMSLDKGIRSCIHPEGIRASSLPKSSSGSAFIVLSPTLIVNS